MALTITVPGFPPNEPHPVVGYGRETIFTISGFQPGALIVIDMVFPPPVPNLIPLRRTQFTFSSYPERAAQSLVQPGRRVTYVPGEGETSFNIGVTVVDDNTLAGLEFQFGRPGNPGFFIFPVVGTASDLPNPPDVAANGAEVDKIEARGVTVTELYVNDELLWKQ